MLRFAPAALSDVGLVREHNEDAGFAGPYLLLVADGVGGHAAGEVASATTAYVVSSLLAHGAAASSRPGAGAGARGVRPAVLRRAVTRSYQQLAAGVAAQPAREGMATTLTALVTHDDRSYALHVGDSRAYVLRGGRLDRLTRDHTVVADLVEAGRLTEAEARSHPYRSVVTRTVDARQPVEPDVTRLDLLPGDRLLVCSDGLTDLVDDRVLALLLGAGTPDEAAAALVRAALRQGGRDNVTCLVADVVDGPPLTGDGQLVGSLRRPELVVDPAALRGSSAAR